MGIKKSRKIIAGSEILTIIVATIAIAYIIGLNTVSASEPGIAEQPEIVNIPSGSSLPLPEETPAPNINSWLLSDNDWQVAGAPAVTYHSYSST